MALCYSIDEEKAVLGAILKKNSLLLSIKEAAKYRSTSESTLRREIKKAVFKYSKRTGKILFRRSSIDRWLDG